MKTNLPLIAALCCALFTTAQVEFTPNIVIDRSLSIESPFDTFAADLDGDGDLDLLTSTYSGDRLLWLENLDGTGTDFTQHDISTDIDNPWNVSAADLDGDGDLDVFAAASGGEHVIWYENTDGSGNFVLKQYISAYEVRAVSAHDIDGDGDLDIVWSSTTDGKMKWSRNTDGIGTFAGTLNVENNVSSIPNFQVVDVDGDGDLDVVSAWNIDGGTKGVSWYENETGSGLFSSRKTIALTTNSISSVHAGDLDGDGDIDVAAAIQSENKVVWYENTDGLGTFSVENVLSDTVESVTKVSIADFDGDGKLDVIAASINDNEINWFQNIGSGNFTSEIFVDTFLGGVRSLRPADIDGDGDLDFTTITSNDNNIKWYNNIDGLGNFSPYTITKNIDGGKTVFAGDLDGDGDSDLLSASHWDDKIAWYENKDGQGDFDDTQLIISETINGASGIFAADIDGDGDNDVVAASSLDNYIVWFENTDGLANFGSPQTIDDAMDSVSKVYVIDIDNDGDMDVFAIGRGKITWYENTDALGAFIKSEIDSINNFTMFALDFGDLDSDNDLDLAVASNAGILYYLNLDGQGVFGSRQQLDASFDGLGVKIADLNSDGNNDIIFTGDVLSGTDYVAWFQNINGVGTFGTVQNISTIVSNSQDVDAYDVDSDGDIDVVSSSYESSGVGIIAWYENTNGLGDFSNSQQIVGTTNGSAFQYDLFIDDINQDNNLDIVTINNLSDQIIWYNNMGSTLVNEINGTVRFDLLGDGCTVTDDLLSSIMVIASSGTASQAAFTQENGQFRIFTTEEGVIDTQITSQLPNYYVSSPTTFQSNFMGLGNTDTVDFCIEPIAAINDLKVSFYPTLNEPRPGFDTRYRIVYKNSGTTQLSGTITFQFDGSKMNFLSATETEASQTTTTVTFNFTDLNPFEVKTIDLDFNVFAPPITNIDDILVATATVNPVSGDETEEDNVFTLEQTVIGSYDPNDITVLEGEEITIEEADKYLHYLIRFQNTGTASAINVRVEHILDDKLDWTTMQLESLSHTGRVEIVDETDVSFIFNNINLADSTTDEPNSHGYIAFKIKPKSDVEVGDIISGTADIFFDFNPPITTNTVNTEIVEPLSVGEFNAQSIQLFPNPAKDQLKITSQKIIDKLTIVDIKGRVLNDIQLSNSEYTLDVSTLTKGVYFLEIQSGESKSTKKFIKN
ncbi:T9SS type A sorting domain-containing protein [Winogradskyella forsetii]|uniref:T9SS type A sorting domain-containing protein n=1 Tax=Winogradskyella forsetii TaxID=2686077 RepID=UPI0015BD8F25|nr:T9SS type A sorting domain-containing protein [Winogradskyella forsetii]